MVFPWLAAATLGGAAVSAYGAHRANKASAASARDVMDFQREMSDTSVRRAMADMEAAGINPLLAGKYGASTPGGSSYSAQNELESIPGGVGSAIQLKRMKAELENLGAQNAQIHSQVALNVASAKKLAAETQLLDYSKLKEKALQPAYDLAGNMVDAGVSTAKEVGRAVGSVPDKVVKGYRYVSGKAKDLGVVAFKSADKLREDVHSAKRYARNMRKYNQIGPNFDID